MNSALKRIINWVSNGLGGKQTEQSAPKKSLQVGTLPAFTQIVEGSNKLPERGRKLFMPVPVEDSALLVGRDEQLLQLDDALEHWKGGRPTSIALVGPQGCGKTSLINCFMVKLRNQSVLRCDIEERLCNEAKIIGFFCRLFQVDPPVDDLEALIEQLRTIEPRIVVIEHAHNLLLRVIGGRTAIDAFLYTVLSTRQQHLWVITCRHFPWNNMERHVGVSQYFTHFIAIDPLPEASLRDALALRLEKSSLNLIFCKDREDAEGKGNPESDATQGEIDVFYKALYSNCGGNFHAALYFLLLCSRYEADKKSLSLWPPSPLEVTFIKEMDRLYQFTIAELVVHGVLSPGEHARIFRTVGIQSKMVLAHLEQLNLLRVIDSPDGNATVKVYDLSPVIHHAVTSALQQLNLLY